MENTLHADILQMRRCIVVVVSLLIGACAGSGQTTQSGAVDSGAASSFSKFLVIGISGDYDSRAQFERMIVSELRRKGAEANTYYSIVGGNKPVSKEDIVAAIESKGFDAVLVVRALDADVSMKIKKSRTEIDATPLGGRIVNLFRSSYTDYTTPGTLDLSTNVTFAIELYSSISEDIIWSMDHSSGREKDLGLLIDKTAATIANRLDRDKLIDN